MKKIYLLFSPLIFACASACTSPGQPAAQRADTADHQRSDAPADTVPVVFTQQKTHRFSDSTQMDTFRLAVRGDDLLQGKAELTITRFDGKVIHQEFFPAEKLLGNQIAPVGERDRIISDQEKKALLTKKLNAFFNPENFIVPATAMNLKKPDTRTPDVEFLNRLKKDQTSVGFRYVLGGRTSGLAFDRETGMVNVYFNSF